MARTFGVALGLLCQYSEKKLQITFQKLHTSSTKKLKYMMVEPKKVHIF